MGKELAFHFKDFRAFIISNCTYTQPIINSQIYPIASNQRHNFTPRLKKICLEKLFYKSLTIVCVLCQINEIELSIKMKAYTIQ